MMSYDSISSNRSIPISISNKVCTCTVTSKSSIHFFQCSFTNHFLCKWVVYASFLFHCNTILLYPFHCLHHPRHATHSTRRHRWPTLLWLVNNHGLRGSEKSRYRRGINNPGPRHLGWINNSCLEHILILRILRIETSLNLDTILDKLTYNHGALLPGIHGNSRNRSPQGTLDDLHPNPLVHITHLGNNVIELCRTVEQRLTSTWYDALLHCRTCGVERIDNTVLLLTHLYFRCTSDLDHRHTAG
mmetsp:Transcript_18926/g.23845  ORF Transcript_18926/g.23845 Transcript_18926/m.23845 type:complete len:245 (-) Transcript_18926:901-1635(-)